MACLSKSSYMKRMILNRSHLVYKRSISLTNLASGVQNWRFVYKNAVFNLQTSISSYKMASRITTQPPEGRCPSEWKTLNECGIIFELSVEILREGILKLRNNVELDLKTKLIEGEMSQTEIADKLGVTVSYVNKITRGREHMVNRTFVAMMEQLGYDVRLVYEKRDET